MTDVLIRTQERPMHTSTAARVLLAVLSGVAGAIHLAMVPSHWNESAVEGIGFAVTGWIQLSLAVWFLLNPKASVLRFAMVANLAFIAIWAVSRTYGLPFGAEPWHAHDPGFVDLVCVGAEAALVIVAGAVLLRHDFGRGWNTSRLAVFAIVPIAVVALGTAALASPSARDHASGSHSHGESGEAAAAGEHGHGGAATSELPGFDQLQNGHQHGSGEVPIANSTRTKLTAQLAATTALVDKYPNIAAAEAAGYRRAGPFSPGLGTHYSNFGVGGVDSLMGEDGPMTPLLIFDGLGPDAPLAGFMYMSYAGGERAPEGFVGPNDHWHYHTNTCIVVGPNGIEAPLGADAENVTQKMCDKYGGNLIQNTGYMVHVWSVPGYESPNGVFSELNPKLPCADGTFFTVPLTKLGTRTSACRGSEV